MKVTLNIPDAVFARYDKASVLIAKSLPFVKASETSANSVFELLLVSELLSKGRLSPGKIAKKFERALRAKVRTDYTDVEDPSQDQEEQGKDLPPRGGTGRPEGSTSGSTTR